jgi:hypothetical protein
MDYKFFDAIKKGDLNEVERLLFLDPSLMYEKENGLSPIMVASYGRKTEITEFLGDAAGSLNIFESAATGRTNQVARHLARDPLLANAYACDGYQPLGLACFFGQYDTAVYLIKAGAVVNSPAHNSRKATPLHSTAAAGHSNIAMLLLHHDANPNTKDGRGCAPLHIAAEHGYTVIIRSLLFNGADLTIRNQLGKLPLELANEAGHAEAVAVLKEGITRRFKALRPVPA